MSHQDQLEKSKYRNWVKGGLAYKYFKEGIERFSDDVVQKEHIRILGTVNNTSGNACNQCSLRSLQPLHISYKDHTGRKRCPWDLSNCNCLYSKKTPCPNNICDVIMEEILKTHGSTPPSPNWKNTDIHKWYTSPWEIAKCFINAPGYSAKTKAADIDASGLLHVYINNKSLHTHLSCNMTGKNIFIKCRERRNKLFHSPAMELDDTKLTKCIDKIIMILKDPKELAATADAQQAVLKLEQLKEKKFIITTHYEAEVCRDALAFITNKTVELNQMIQEAKDDIDRKKADASKAIDDKIQIDLEDALKDNSDINVLKHIVESLTQRVNSLEEDNSQMKTRLMELDKSIDTLKDVKDQQMVNLKYVKEKQALQDGLVKLYQRHYIKTSLSPLKTQENDINIDEVYVEPKMVAVEADEQETGDVYSRRHEERLIHGYHDLFRTNGRENKAIYIVGDFGTGKSSYCKMMIQDWCKAASESPNISVSTHGDSMTCETDASNTIGTFRTTHESKKFIDSNYTDDSEHFISVSGSDSDHKSANSVFISSDAFDKNVVQMKKFDFLFYIPLRNMSTFCETLKMIQAFCTSENLPSTDLIEKVFAQDSERCLIVIDGLDEWRPQQMDTILSHESSGLPSKRGINNATVVTLSRPSAKGMLNIKRSEFDQKVELKGIFGRSLYHFINRYLPKIKKTLSSYSLMNKIEESKLKHLEKTPLLLQQLVWMHCNDIAFGKSVSDIYSHLVNIMFGWFQIKTDSSDSEYDFSDNAEQYNQMTLPQVLNSFPRCEENKRLLIQIAKVAFESLMSKEDKNSISRSCLKKHGFSKTDISSLIDVGILVEENCYDPTQDSKQFSFTHMSYLEFFAAVYASCQFNNQPSDQNTPMKELFQNCKTSADILQLSNLLKSICGLCPFLITQVSHFISDIVKRDEKLITYRSNGNLTFDSSLLLIQQLICSCLFEWDTDNKPMVHLSDVYIDNSIEISSFRSIVLDNVLSLNAQKCLDEEVWRWISHLKHLQYLQVSFSIIPHCQMQMLLHVIQEAPLRCLFLRSVQCKQPDCRNHSIDLSKHDRLQKVTIGDCDRIRISDINTEHLKTVQINSSWTLDIGLLQNARSLAELHLGFHVDRVSRLTYNSQVDSNVHTLHQLQTLTITNAVIDENTLTVTDELRNLRLIELNYVIMSLKTWCSFIDSILTLQQSVEIDTTRNIDNIQFMIGKSDYIREKGNYFFEIITDKMVVSSDASNKVELDWVFLRFRKKALK